MFLNLYLPNIDVASNRAENDFETDLEKLIGIGVNEENEDAHGKIGTNLYALIKLLKQK